MRGAQQHGRTMRRGSCPLYECCCSVVVQRSGPGGARTGRRRLPTCGAAVTAREREYNPFWCCLSLISAITLTPTKVAGALSRWRLMLQMPSRQSLPKGPARHDAHCTVPTLGTFSRSRGRLLQVCTLLCRGVYPGTNGIISQHVIPVGLQLCIRQRGLDVCSDDTAAHISTRLLQPAHPFQSPSFGEQQWCRRTDTIVHVKIGNAREAKFRAPKSGSHCVQKENPRA